MDHEEDDFHEPWDCPTCAGEVVPMGTLGTLEHGRCRDCGVTSSRSTEAAFDESLKGGTILSKITRSLRENGLRGQEKRPPQKSRDEKMTPAQFESFSEFMEAVQRQ